MPALSYESAATVVVVPEVLVLGGEGVGCAGCCDSPLVGDDRSLETRLLLALIQVVIERQITPVRVRLWLDRESPIATAEIQGDVAVLKFPALLNGAADII